MSKSIDKLLKEDKRILSENQLSMININSPLNEVITLQEASEILGCADSTLRMQVLKGKYKDGVDYRKAKGIILFNKFSIDEKKREKQIT